MGFSFEVEYTTAITDAFMRCSAIPESYQARRFIVIPEEREKFMYRKLYSQLLRERVEKENWKLIFFKNLREFHNKNKRKKSINPMQILEIATLPIEEREKQATLDSFRMQEQDSAIANEIQQPINPHARIILILVTTG